MHVKGSQFEQEPGVEHPLLSGPHLQGSHVLHQVVADVLWSHLLVGKAKTHEHANKSAGVLEFHMNGKKRGHTKDSHADRSVKALR